MTVQSRKSWWSKLITGLTNTVRVVLRLKQRTTVRDKKNGTGSGPDRIKPSHPKTIGEVDHSPLPFPGRDPKKYIPERKSIDTTKEQLALRLAVDNLLSETKKFAFFSDLTLLKPPSRITDSSDV